MKMKVKDFTAEMGWTLIARMGWGTRSTNYGALAREFYTELGKAGMKRLEAFVDARVSDLYQAVEKYEDDTGHLECGSDDSFSDLRYHVVGLGQQAFDAAMANPKLLEDRYRKHDYKESFSYCFQEPEPPRTQADKDKTLEDTVKLAEQIDEQLDDIRALVNKVSQNTLILRGLISLTEKDRKTP